MAKRTDERNDLPDDEQEEAMTESADEDFALSRPYEVPADGWFGDKGMKRGEDLIAMASEIKSRWPEHFKAIGSMDAGIYWRRKKSTLMGEEKWYDTRKASELEMSTLNIRFVVWIAADYCRDTPVTRADVYNALVHSLLHIHEGEDGGLKFRRHTFEGFLEELDLIGPWTAPLERAERTFFRLEQDALHEGEGDADEAAAD